MTVTYRVTGVTCGGCASSLTNAIKLLSAAADVTVNVEAKTFTVDGFDDAKAIEQAVKDAGFEFGGPVP